MNYFNSIRGKGVVSGQFIETGDPASVTTGPLAQLEAETGQYVGMIGIDYWHFNTGGNAIVAAANQAAIQHWQSGGLVTLSLSMPNPTTGGGIQDTSYVDAQGLLTPGTPTNAALNQMLTQVGEGLRQLQDAGVPVLFRPYHENNGDWFWWGAGNLSASQFQDLWRYTHDYLTDTMGLHNLAWVYSINTGTALGGRSLTDTYPGGQYVDITGQDLYSNDASAARSTYESLKQLGKPTAMTEFGSGTPADGNTDFSMPTLIDDLQYEMPDIVYWIQWWSQNGGRTGWGMEIDRDASAALNRDYVINRGEIAGSSSGTPTDPPNPPDPPVTPSPNDTVIVAGSGDAIIDASGNAWTITANGQVAVNGVTDQTTARVVTLAYEDGLIWQENADNLWWSKTQPADRWGPEQGTATSPLPGDGGGNLPPVEVPGDTLTLVLSGDSYQGSPQFIARIDGETLTPEPVAVTAAHGADTQSFEFVGNWGAGTHDIEIGFVNDLWDGSRDTDRNLYVEAVSYRGQSVSSQLVPLYGEQVVHFQTS
ncbi:MAG: glycosyl hydrolase [Acetobacteraceae bacterium]